MRALAQIFGRAFLQVALVAANTRFIASSAYPAAFATGFCISWLWWANSRSAAHASVCGARVAYALGAASGTVVGMAIAGVWR